MGAPILVCGFGNVGYRVVELLLRLGEEVAVVSLGGDEARCREAEGAGVRLLRGDARNERLLAEAGLGTAKALIAVTDQDLVNIEVALDARRERPGLPVVLRLFDQNLARQLEGPLGLSRALGMEALAAPSFAAAALGDAVVARLDAGAVPLVVASLTVMPEEAETLVDFAVRHHAVPLAVHHGGPGWERRPVGHEAHPSRGLPTQVEAAASVPACGPRAAGELIALPTGAPLLATGDRVLVLARREDWERQAGASSSVARAASAAGQGAPPGWEPEPLPAAGQAFAPAPSRLHGLAAHHGAKVPAWWHALGEAWRESSIVLRGVLAALSLTLASSVLVFRHALALSWVDALYFTVTTVTTTGYGDITVRESGAWLKLYVIAMMVMGSGFVAVIYSLITDILIKERFRQAFGGRRMPAAGHVIVTAMDEVGSRVVRELGRAGTAAVAVVADPDSPLTAAVRGQAALITGDARLAPTLRKARVGSARAVVAATGDDAFNLAVCLAAKRLAPGVRVVARVFDPGFAGKVQSVLGIDAVLGASRIAAPSFVAAALLPGATQACVVADRFFVFLEREVGEDWAGCTPRDLRAREGTAVLIRQGTLVVPHSQPTGLEELPLAIGERVLIARCLRLGPGVLSHQG